MCDRHKHDTKARDENAYLSHGFTTRARHSSKTLPAVAHLPSVVKTLSAARSSRSRNASLTRAFNPIR